MSQDIKINVNGVNITLTNEQLREINRQQNKQKSVMERIQNFDDIMAECGKPSSYFTDPTLSKDERGYRKIKAIAEVYNEGWVADYKDKTQKKWYPYFEYRLASSSFGFSLTYFGDWFTAASGGSRLCAFKSEELAKDAATKFVREYNEFLD